MSARLNKPSTSRKGGSAFKEGEEDEARRGYSKEGRKVKWYEEKKGM